MQTRSVNAWYRIGKVKVWLRRRKWPAKPDFNSAEERIEHLALIGAILIHRNKKRRNSLLEKYRDEDEL